VRPVRARDGSVGVIGSGPAGLAAAEQLRRCGYQVTVYDRHDRVGGLLIYGIPNFKLEKSLEAFGGIRRAVRAELRDRRGTEPCRAAR
jgi:glutamate synthase (NADPH) small chain